jgi:hypothetical protein
MKFLPVILALLCSVLSLRADDATLRRELDRAYSSWRDALVTRSFSGWQQATAASRQVITRNLIVSQQQPCPSALFALPMKPPETTTLRFVKVQAEGDTAHLVYFGKVDIGIADPAEIPDNVLLLKFIKETTGWKFDTTRLINLAPVPEVRAALGNGGSSAFLNEPEFLPTGKIPSVPKACPVPDRIGVLQVASFGYQTQAQVNGFEVASVENNAEEHIIIGGLRDGENPLTLSVKTLPIPPGDERSLEVNAIVLTGKQERPTITVFSWKPESKTVPEEVKLLIHVSKITLR